MNRRLLILPALALASLLMVSCGGDKEEDGEKGTTETANIPSVPSDYTQHVIEEGDYTGTISLPENAYIYTSKLINNDGTIDVLNCQLDQAGSNAVLVKPLQGSFQDYVNSEIKEDKMNEFNEFLIEESDLVMYSYKDFMDKEKMGYNFAMHKDGMLLTGSAESFGDLSKEDAAALIAIAKTYKK